MTDIRPGLSDGRPTGLTGRLASDECVLLHHSAPNGNTVTIDDIISGNRRYTRAGEDHADQIQRIRGGNSHFLR